MTYFGRKKSYLNEIELPSYILTANAIHYGQTLLAFLIKKDIFHLGFLHFKEFAKICLPVTESVVQAK